MRKDGKRVRGADAMYTLIPYIMKHRYDAMNMIEVDIPIAAMQAYLNRKRNEGVTMSHLGVVLAGYLRTVAEFPLLNRFVVNKRIYARNEFPVAMVVLKPGETEGTMSKMRFEPGDDIFTVHRKMNEYIEKNRQVGDTNATDDLMRRLLSVPGLANVGVGLFKLLDRYGLLPKSLIDASPFHASSSLQTWRASAPTISSTTCTSSAPPACSSPSATCARSRAARATAFRLSVACPWAS